ncbi:HAD family hydrolase [Infirmifilum lucidum]|uniref:HAD family hydrolase n=1 Tax=Infirmifilum lucidum TaxID=2776706 RepID=A0A7L9FHA6_9CREN|nr:HAD family hydrolase [Infirmifilum lucidum]QOJ79208.1 HAD family hydrolase [Infirmifilum lucidum]
MQDLKALVERVKVFSFDIDGTIIDSYSYMRDVIEILLLYLGVPANMLQPVSNDAVDEWYRLERSGTMDYSKMLIILLEAAGKRGLKLSPDAGEFDELLVEARVKASPTLPCAVRVLRELKNKGKVVVSVSGGDGVPGMKRKRIDQGELSKFFDEIIVVPEDAPSRVEALARVAEKYKASYSEVVHVDDRVEHANNVAEAGFQSILVKTGMFNPERPVNDGVIVLENLCQLYEALAGERPAVEVKRGRR